MCLYLGHGPNYKMGPGPKYEIEHGTKYDILPGTKYDMGLWQEVDKVQNTTQKLVLERVQKPALKLKLHKEYKGQW